MTLRPAVSALLLAATGCASVQPLWQPEQFIAAKSPDVVYVTARDQLVTAVTAPRVSGDTLYGVAQADHRQVAIPLDQVGVSARRVHAGRTALLVAGITGFTGLAALALLTSGESRDDWVCDYSVDAREMNGGAPICGPRTFGS